MGETLGRCQHSFAVRDVDRKEVICSNCGMRVPEELIVETDRAVTLGGSQEMLLLALYADKQRIASYIRGSGKGLVRLVDDHNGTVLTVRRVENEHITETVWQAIKTRLYCPICGVRSPLSKPACDCMKKIEADLPNMQSELQELRDDIANDQ